MSEQKLKVGIIGANWTLLAHAPAWRLLPNVEVAAICTAHQETAEEAARTHGIPRAYWDFHEMAQDRDLHIIDVGTQPALRYDMVMAALDAGKHVYNCLPFAVDVQKAEAMRNLQKKKGVVGVVDAQFRWVPAVRRLKEMIAEGRLGDFYQATIHVQMPLLAYDGYVYPYCVQSASTKPYRWLGDAKSGGSAWRNFGSHTMLNLIYLFGPIEEVIGLTATCCKQWKLTDGSTITPDTADFGAALVRFRDGGFANINVSWSATDAGGYFLEVLGSRGRFVVRDPSFADAPTATLYHGDSRLRDHSKEIGSFVELPDRLFQVPGTPFSRSLCPPFAMPMAAMFTDMIGAIREGREGSPSFEEATHVHRAVEAVMQSERTRAWVKLEDVT